MQPYAHLEPLRRALRKLGVPILEVKPRDTERVIREMGDGYCGLTPLPLIVRYGLRVYRGPVVATRGCSPSLVVVLPRRYSSICECRGVRVASESVATRAYLSLALRRLCGAERVAREGECLALIGDRGVRAWLEYSGSRIVELSPLFREAFGFEPVMAATAGPGCHRLSSVLGRLARLEARLMDVLRVASKLRLPLPLAERYLRCISLAYNESLVYASIALLHSSKHLNRPHPATT